MSISNLHTLINRPWYIEQQYAEANFPLLLNVLNGKSDFSAASNEQFISFMNSKGEIKADVFGGIKEEKYVAVVSLKTPIYKYNQECGPRGTKTKMQQLDEYKDSSNIAGIVLDIDSGGGQVYGTPEFHDYIKSYPKPVVAYTDGLMCSAAYYIGSGASYIVANKRAEAIGSIGAYSQFLDLQGYYEKQGAKLHTIYASKSTDKNKGYRDALEGNYETYIKEDLDPIVDEFINDMKASRPTINSEVFSGATYPAPIALTKGLIDEIGTIETAINKVFELSEKNKSISTTMSKNSYPKIEAVLEMETGFESNAEGVYLNDEQLTAVDERITELEATVNLETTQKQTAITAKETAETALVNATTENETIVNQVNETLDLQGDAKVTTVKDAFAALNAKIEALGQQPGATHTTVKTSEETVENAQMDFNTPFYKTTKQLFKN